MRRTWISMLVATACLTGHPVSAQTYSPPASSRVDYNFNPGWKLFVGDPTNAQLPGFDDSSWTTVTLPHAWNEDSAFKVFIANMPTGIAWYRKHFTMPPGSGGQKVFLEFEGMRQAGDVYINGQWAGRTENGVMASGFDITTNLLAYPQDNVVAVRTDNSFNYKEVATGVAFEWNSSSFYANYGGINKNVKLHLTGLVHQTLPLFSNLGTVGTYIYGQNYDIPDRSGVIHADTQVLNEDAVAHTLTYNVVIVDTNGVVLTNFPGTSMTIQPGQTNVLTASSLVTNLNFWSWGYGYLYDVYTILSESNNVLDVVRTRTGFRGTAFTNGMVVLNGRVINIRGYAQRSTDEWPAIGCSVPTWMDDYSQRQVVDEGGNTMRWMHVTPGKQIIEACDRQGLMMSMPAGDQEGDVTGVQWNQRMTLMRDAIIYNKNNPSILFYESGNTGIAETQMVEMKGIRDQYDPYGGRAIGCREMLASTNAEYGGEMLYVDKSARKPMWMMEYSRDEDLRKYWDNFSPPYHLDGVGYSYDGSNPSAYVNRNRDSMVVENVTRWHEDYYVQRPGTGTRVNAGGVKIIYSDSNTQCRGVQNYRRSGAVDALRIPKDTYFAHQVMWDCWVDVVNPEIYIVGHWNYSSGTVKDVYVVSTAASVQLFLNGQSLGYGVQSYGFLYTWPGVTWTPGTLQAVGYDSLGNQVCTDTRVTVGPAVAIQLTPILDPTGWKADGQDLAMFQVEVVDALGQRCPTNLDMISFAVSGPAEWRGGIGTRSDTAPADNYILSTNLPVECGVNRVLVRSTTNAGPVTLIATAPGLISATTNVPTIPFAVTNGLAVVMPGDGLLPNYSRGPTPLTPSYQASRVAVPVASIAAGAGSSGNLTNTIDDDETTSWTSSSTLGNNWIQFTLGRTALVSQVVVKFLSPPRNGIYPISIQVNGATVYSDTTPATSGYMTMDLSPPTLGNTVRISRTTSGSFPILEAEIYEPATASSIPAPAAPTGLTATPVSPTQINLVWTDNATNETGYRIEQSTDNVNFTQMFIPMPGATNFTNGDLVPGTKNYYRVRALNATGVSTDATASATTPYGTAATPFNLTAAAGDGVVALNWDPVPGVTGYNLKRSTNGGSSYTTIVSLNTNSYLDTGLADGTNYFYVVSATNPNGEGSNSVPASATPVATSIYEAENASLNGVGIGDDEPGFSGTGFGDYLNSSGAYISWNVNAPSNAVYSVAIRYALASGSLPLQLMVNGSVAVASLNFPATGGLANWALVTNNVTLNTGNNIIQLTDTGSSGPNVDYLQRLNAVAVAPPPPTGTNLVWKGAISSQWDDVTANWLSGSTASVFADGCYATFNDTATSANVNIAAPVSPVAVTFSNSTLNYLVSGMGGGGLAGSTGLTKSGTNILTLSGTNTYTGNTTVLGGNLTVSGGTLGTSVSTILVGNGAAGVSFKITGGTVTANTLNVATVASSTGDSAAITGSGSANFTSVNLGSSGNTTGPLTINTTGSVALGTLIDFKDNGGVGPNTAAGLIISNGSVTATSIAIQNANSGANMNLTGGSLTIGSSASTGAFKIGNNTSSTPRGGWLTMSGGSLTYLGTDGLLMGTVANATNSVNINGPSSVATLTGITLNQASSSGNTMSSLLVSNGATLYLGGAGLVINQPTATVFAAIGNGTATIGAIADWSSVAPITLAGNTTFKAADASSIAHNISLGGVLSGAGVLTKTGSGTLTISGNNTYNGGTTISHGTLLANNVAGSATGTGLVTVAGGTLAGTGIISSVVSVNAGGVLAPGNPFGTLTVSNNLTLSAGSTNFMQVQHSPLTNNSVKVTGILTEGGTLNVTNLGGTALAAGDTFTLFNAASYNGAFANVILPSLPVGLAWNTNNLNTAGTLSVVVTAKPVIGTVSISGGGLALAGTGGVANASFYLLGSTNLSTPVSNWTRLLTNQFDNSGNFNFTNGINSNTAQSFYLLQLQ